MDERIRLLGILQLALGAFGGIGALIAFVVLGGTAGVIELAADGGREVAFVVWLLGALAFGVGFINLLFAVVPIMFVLPYFNRYFFRVTGRIYLGPMVTCLIFIMILISNTVFYLPL